MRRRGIVIAVAAVVALPAPASADTVLGEIECGPAADLRARECGTISAFAGWVAWSSYDSTQGAWVLWTSVGGQARQQAVAGSSRPFDVELGPDASGRPSAVYSRCAQAPGRCAIATLDLASGMETRLRGVVSRDPLLPSRWRTRIALARRSPQGRRRVEVCRIVATAVGGCRPRRGGPPGSSPGDPENGPTRIDLSGRWLAVAWHWVPRGEPEARDTTILLMRATGSRKPRRVASAGGVPDLIPAVHTPVLSVGRLYYARGTSGCSGGGGAMARYDIGSRIAVVLPAPDLAGLAVTGNRLVRVACPTFPEGVMTPIVELDPNPFTAPGAPDPARAARCPEAPRAHPWRTRTVARIGAVPLATALVLRAGGRATALWDDAGAARTAERGRRGRWTTPRTLDPRAIPFGSAWAATAPNGAYAAAWRASPTASGAAVTALTGRVDAPPRAPQVLQRDPTAPDLLTIPTAAVAADGGAAVAWQDRGRPLVAVREPGASRFGPPAAVPTSQGSALHATTVVAVAPGGRALLASLSPAQEGNRLEVAERAPDGTWSAATPSVTFPARISSLAGAALGPAGRAIVVAGGAGSELWAATRPAGDDFGPPERLSTAGVVIASAVVEPEPGGGASAAWTESDITGVVSRVRVARAPAGGPFAAAHHFGDVRGRADQLSLAALDDGSALVSWRLDCRRDGTRVLAGRRGRDGALSGARVISGPDARPLRPAAALDGAGRTAVLWATRRPRGRVALHVAGR